MSLYLPLSEVLSFLQLWVGGWGLSKLWTDDHTEEAAAELSFCTQKTPFRYTIQKEHFTYLTVNIEILQESYFVIQHGV